MNDQLRDALDNIYDARVPTVWLRGSWTSSSIGFWFTELIERNNQFRTWCFKGRPNMFWMTGFFNPQGFLTAMRQEVARLHQWPLDQVALNNKVLDIMAEECKTPPAVKKNFLCVVSRFLNLVANFLGGCLRIRTIP